MPPTPENDYQVGPTEIFSRAVWNAALLSIAQRLAAREALEANFEALIAGGTQAALDLIQENVGPQVASLAANVQALEEQLAEILSEGTAANSVLLGGQAPAFYLALANATGTLPVDKVSGVSALISAAVDALKDGVGGDFDTLAKIAAALGNRLRFDGVQSLSDPQKAQALANLGFANRLAPAGSILWMIGTSAPAGYLKLNGSLLSRTVYADLWSYAQSSGALVSEASWTAGSWGCFGQGDGATTFRLPDARGEFFRAWDDGRGVDTGRAIGSLQASQNLAHNHPVTDPGHAHAGGDTGHGHVFGQTLDAGPFSTGSHLTGHGGNVIDNSPYQINTGYANVVIYGAATGISIQNAGGAEARPRSLSALACIKF